MAFFTVYEPPEPACDRIDRGANVAFVGDHFDWGAALLGPLWLLSHRLWLALLAYGLGIAALLGVLMVLGANPDWVGPLALAANIILGFEAGSLRRLAMEGRGWSLIGAVTARTRLEGERRFFDDWLVRQPILTSPAGDPPVRPDPGGPNPDRPRQASWAGKVSGAGWRWLANR